MLLVHTRSGRIVCAVSNEQARAEFKASELLVVVGEEYKVIVDQTDKCVSVMMPSLRRRLERLSRLTRLSHFRQGHSRRYLLQGEN